MNLVGNNMNCPSDRFGHFTSLVLAGLVALAACTQTDSIGTGGKEDGGSPQGGAVGQGGSVAVGGSPATGGRETGSGGAVGPGGAAGGSVGAGGAAGGSGGATGVISCEEAPTTGARCTSLPAGKVCRLGDSCLGGCAPDCSCKDGFWSCENVCRDCLLGPSSPSSGGPLVCSVFCDYEAPRLDAGTDTADGADLPTLDAGSDAAACTDPNPTLVTCLTRKDQCVPSNCFCAGEDGWACTADCRSTSLPLCDGGVGPEIMRDAAGPDAVPDVAAAEAPAPANYSCRNDSDCCIAIDTCNEVAYLYSNAPGATGRPSFSSSTTCVPCISPAVQVRCDQGQCVGEKIPTGVDYNSSLRKDHCGPVSLPDAGASSMYQPAYAGAQPTSWGC
jgi:hypothetical protein